MHKTIKVVMRRTVYIICTYMYISSFSQHKWLCCHCEFNLLYRFHVLWCLIFSKKIFTQLNREKNTWYLCSRNVRNLPEMGNP